MKRRAHLRLPSAQSISSSQAGPRHSLSTASSSLPAPSLSLPTLPTPPQVAISSASSGMEWFTNPFEPEPIDYFNYKPRTYFATAANSPSDPIKANVKPGLTSYFSPMITPAPTEALARPSSPTLFSFIPTRLPPTPEDGPFPYMSYESTYKSSPLLFPVPPTSLPSRPRPLSPATRDLVDIKVYFRVTDDLIKFRIDPKITLRDFIRTAAKRMPTGWESLFEAEEGAEIKDVASIDPKELARLSKEPQWQSWLHRSRAAQKRRVLWAV